MITLNLAYPDRSDIKYNISKFPDGQKQITILDENLGGNFYDLRTNRYPIIIKSRLNNFQDLELIICSVASLRELGVKEIHFYTPYFLGSRSDRKFEEGSNNYLKDVICPIINSMNFSSVTVLDPHSDVLEACLNGFKKESNYRLIEYALRQLKGDWQERSNNAGFILVSPDAGASKKIYKIADQIGYKGDIITCSKDRDADGKLTKCVVPLSNVGKGFMEKDYVIIDDICDGGATFINIAREIKGGYWGDFKGKLYLIVTHGIFSKGILAFKDYFDGIYCTNSYGAIQTETSTEDKWVSTHVKQLDVFN